MSVIPSVNPIYGTTQFPTAVPNSQQVVIPQITFPQPLQYNAMQPSTVAPDIQGPQLNKVHGMDGAKQFLTVPNAMYALFDDDDDVFYVKVTDKNNYPTTLKRYRFVEEEEPAPASVESVTKDEYSMLAKEVENLKEEIRALKEGNANAKQPVRSKTAKATVDNATANADPE